MQLVQIFNLSSCFYSPFALLLSYNRAPPILEDQELFCGSAASPCCQLARSLFSALCHQLPLSHQRFYFPNFDLLLSLFLFSFPLWVYVGLCPLKKNLSTVIYCGFGEEKLNPMCKWSQCFIFNVAFNNPVVKAILCYCRQIVN